MTGLATGPDGEIASASLDRSGEHEHLLSPVLCCVSMLLVTAHVLYQQMGGCSTLRLWKDGKCTAVLEGHTGAVQCVLYLPSGEIVSGSNDNSIRVWSGEKCLHVLSGHTDTVRCSIALVLTAARRSCL